MRRKNLDSESLLEIALASHRNGKLEDAIIKYKKILSSGQNPEASNGLALALRDLGRGKDAINAVEAALKIKPKDPILLNSYGTILAVLGKHDEAIRSFNSSVSITPDYAEAWANLGLSLSRASDHVAAKQALTTALKLNPEMLPLYYQLGRILNELGDPLGAEKHFNIYLGEKPDDAMALNELGNAIFSQGRFEDARDIYKRAICIRTDFLAALNNLGSTLRRLADLDGAIRAYDSAIKLDPTHAEVRCNRALTLLCAGQYEEGFIEYDWRWKCHCLPRQCSTQRSKWKGEELSGQTFLGIAEQGLGDSLQFSRYLPMLAHKGAKVFFCCQEPLVPLFEKADYLEAVFGPDDIIPECDLFAPLLDLPRYFDISSVMNLPPTHLPSLPAEKFKVQGIKVGLVWAGNAFNVADIERSFPLSILSRLFEIKNVDFFSLQVGNGREDLQKFPEVTDIGYRFKNFADTARAIAGLDLIISADTAVAHLSASMNVPTWILLSNVPDWRWGLKGKKSIWYPSVSLFRQKTPGDWMGVSDQVMTRLSLLLRKPFPAF